MIRLIQATAYSEIYLAFWEKEMEKVVLKISKLVYTLSYIKQSDESSKEENILSEYSVLKSIPRAKRKHIVSCLGKFKHVFQFETGLQIYANIIVLEYCHGQNLFDAINNEIIKKPSLIVNEFHRKRIIYQLIETIYILHSFNIYHLDLILDNIIYDGKNIKIIDFGLAFKNPDSSLCGIRSGKTNYFPPEMYKSPKYDGKLRDIWSIGVISYMLYSYQPLINSKYKEEQLRILNTSSIYQYLQIYNTDGLKWDKLFIDFISHCLTANPANRWEAWELLNHDFLKIRERKSIFDRFIGWLSPKSKKEKCYGYKSNNTSSILSDSSNNNNNNNSFSNIEKKKKGKEINNENDCNNKCSINIRTD